MPQVQRERNTIQFNYYKDNDLINIKYRDGDKNFKLVKDAERILYGLDDIKVVRRLLLLRERLINYHFMRQVTRTVYQFLMVLLTLN